MPRETILGLTEKLEDCRARYKNMTESRNNLKTDLDEARRQLDWYKREYAYAQGRVKGIFEGALTEKLALPADSEIKDMQPGNEQRTQSQAHWTMGRLADNVMLKDCPDEKQEKRFGRY